MKGIGCAAVHFGFPAGTHLQFQFCVVSQRRIPRICHRDWDVVIGLLQILKQDDLGMSIYKG